MKFVWCLSGLQNTLWSYIFSTLPLSKESILPSMLLLLLHFITASAILVLHHGFCCTVLHHCLCYTGSAPRLLLHWVLGLQSSTLLPGLQASTLPSGIQASTQIFKHQHCYLSSKHHHCFRSSCVITAFSDLQVSFLLPDLQVSPLLPLHCIGHCLSHWIYTSSEVPTNLSLYRRKSPHHIRCVILLASYTCKVRWTSAPELDIVSLLFHPFIQSYPFSKITLARSGRPLLLNWT